MKIVAVVLNWRRADDTIACVASLSEASPEATVVVVDNGSADGSPDRIRAAHPGVRVIENDSNLGYAGGNNVGITAALAEGADAVFVVNNDVLVLPGCVATLAEELRHADAAIVAPLSLAADGVTVDFLKATLDVRAMTIVADERGHPLPSSTASRVRTDYATGSALLIDARFLERCGAFDESFFLVWEDVDLSLRARADGRDVIVSTGARVHHAGSASFGGAASPLYQYFFVRNSFLVARKHVGWPHRTRTLRRIERRYRGWIGQAEPDVARAIALGIDHGLAGRFGPPPPEMLPS